VEHPVEERVDVEGILVILAHVLMKHAATYASEVVRSGAVTNLLGASREGAGRGLGSLTTLDSDT
jgi:hypothetical protein